MSSEHVVRLMTDDPKRSQNEVGRLRSDSISLAREGVLWPFRRLARLVCKALMELRPPMWMFYDAVVAVVALRLAYVFNPFQGIFIPETISLFAIALFTVATGTMVGLYERHKLLEFIELLVSVVAAALLGIIGLSVFNNVVLFERTGRWILFLTELMLIGGMLLPRVLGHLGTRFYKVRVLYLGTRESVEALQAKLKTVDSHVRLVGYTDPAGDESDMGVSASDIASICHEHRIDTVVITQPYLNDQVILDRCFLAARTGTVMIDENSFYEDAFEQVLVDRIDPSWFFRSRIAVGGHLQGAIKWLLDKVIALICLVVTAPLFPTIWLLVRATSKGPGLYTQIRCGQFGSHFRIYKFRTMTVDAESRGAKWAQVGDSRVTAVGRFLRKSRLDEIPQFWNVLKGDMSFVGPRPERPDMVALIEGQIPFFSYRNWARPGITGLAQIRYRYGASIDDAREKLQHDLYYIKNWSLLLDLQIIMRTFSAIGKGAR